jgi:hypothetical protein
MVLSLHKRQRWGEDNIWITRFTATIYQTEYGSFWRPTFPAGRALGEGKPEITGCSLTLYSGFYAPERPGATCLQTTAAGKTRTAAFAGGGTRGYGNSFWSN